MPATFSRKVLIDLLRGRMGFDGVVVTDALNMAPAKRWPPGEAAVRALLAGNDLLLMPPDLPAAHAGLRAALRDGRLPRARLVEAVTRVLTLKFRLAGRARPGDVRGGHAAHVAGRGRAQPRRRHAAARPVRRAAGARAGHGDRGRRARERPSEWLVEALRAAGVKVVPTRRGRGPSRRVRRQRRRPARRARR